MQLQKKKLLAIKHLFIFDNSTLDIYLMMFTGATLNLIPEQLFMFPAKLLEYVNNCNINFYFLGTFSTHQYCQLKSTRLLEDSSACQSFICGGGNAY